FGPDAQIGGTLLAQMHRDGVTLWDVPQRALRHTFISHSNTYYAATHLGTSSISSVAFSPNGRLLATCGRDGTVALYDIGSLQLVRTLAAPPLSDVAFSADGLSVIASGDHGFLACWLINKALNESLVRPGDRVRTYYGHSDPIERMSLS